MAIDKTTNLFYSGLSGLQVPVPKYAFPEPYQHVSRLTYYSTFFNSIEINSSFYKIPLASTIQKWSLSVPDDFKFTFKLWRQITHINGLHFNEPDVALFFKCLADIGKKSGCLLIQFPPSITNAKIAQLEHLLHCIQQLNTKGAWEIAVEFRHKSWYTIQTYQLLDSYKAAIVVHDMPKSVTPLIDHQTDFMYVRFHGPTGDYKGSYSESFLEEYAGYITDWINEYKKVYVYFNNTIGDAFKNLQTLNTLLESLSKSVAQKI